ncbi:MULTISPECIES: transcriptional regulator [Pseudomonas]|uniref:transcriptional regulator n=1 Tax=Pseudomonas TaxID=286 RepID=UPI000818FD85|nr:MULTISPECIES: transcriptional regulator [Pseudomonas]MBH3458988.1 transcriptional regulator [Pseudomonas putida]MBK0061719.1 transcriptional regulator [Pseudomonas sp. S44]OCT24985.1 transcriptional regulator [Pseudomonas putida]OCT28972.1 transcriptional regulator [Pseudomonas putida]OCT35993.1 transcriptional regulator [Pseudomonas putida]
MSTYDWDLIERLLHEVQNGAGHSFTPRPYAEQHAAAMAAKGQPVGDLDQLKTRACEYEKLLFQRGFIESRPEEDGGNGENFVLTERGSRLLSLIDSAIPGADSPRLKLDQQADALDESTFDQVSSKPQITPGAI